MELNQIKRDGQTRALNGSAPDGITIVLEPAGQPAGVQAALATRPRSRFYPAVDDVGLNVRTLSFVIVHRPASYSGDSDDYNDLVWQWFQPTGETAVTLTGTWNGDTYSKDAWITNFGRTSVAEWRGQLVVTDPYFLSTTTTSSSSSPLTVGGNAATRPSIEIKDGVAITHYRATLRDRTGHGFAGWPVGITVENRGASTFRAFFDGHEVPFTKDGTTLWVFGAAKAGQTSYVDVYQGTGINNTTHAGVLETGGLDLTSFGNTFTSDPGTARTQPLNAALTWHPGITFKPSDSRNYTFGLDGDTLTMIDRAATGTRYSLNDDADAFVLASPVPMTKISGLELSVFSGYVPGLREVQGTADSTRVLRVIISDIDGGFESGPTLDSDLLSEPGGDGPRHADKPYYAQWTFGDITFPGTYQERHTYAASEYGLGAGSVTVDIWYEDYLPSEFKTVAERYIGGTVTTGAPGVWYLHFGADAFNGAEPPDLSMSILPKGSTIVRTTGGGTDITTERAGRTDLDNAIVFQTDWVDPTTLEPFADEVPEEPLSGRIKAVLKYALRDSEGDWITAWSQTVTGTTVGGTTATISVPDTALPNAIGVAVGLEPVSTNPAGVDWGTLEVTSAPTITLNSSQTPSVSVTSVAAQRLDGDLKNDDSGEFITFNEVFSDATGLTIDTSKPEITQVGMLYGEILASGGLRMFDLAPGTISWTAGGNLDDATITFTYANRLAH